MFNSSRDLELLKSNQQVKKLDLTSLPANDSEKMYIDYLFSGLTEEEKQQIYIRESPEVVNKIVELLKDGEINLLLKLKTIRSTQPNADLRFNDMRPDLLQAYCQGKISRDTFTFAYMIDIFYNSDFCDQKKITQISLENPNQSLNNEHLNKLHQFIKEKNPGLSKEETTCIKLTFNKDIEKGERGKITGHAALLHGMTTIKKDPVTNDLDIYCIHPALVNAWVKENTPYPPDQSGAPLFKEMTAKNQLHYGLDSTPIFQTATYDHQEYAQTNLNGRIIGFSLPGQNMTYCPHNIESVDDTLRILHDVGIHANSCLITPKEYREDMLTLAKNLREVHKEHHNDDGKTVDAFVEYLQDMLFMCPRFPYTNIAMFNASVPKQVLTTALYAKSYEELNAAKACDNPQDFADKVCQTDLQTNSFQSMRRYVDNAQGDIFLAATHFLVDKTSAISENEKADLNELLTQHRLSINFNEQEVIQNGRTKNIMELNIGDFTIDCLDNEGKFDLRIKKGAQACTVAEFTQTLRELPVADNTTEVRKQPAYK